MSDRLYNQGLQITKSQVLAPFDDAWKKPVNEYNLPQSIYSGAMIFPLSVSWNDHNMSDLERVIVFFFPVFNYFLILTLTFTGQYLFMWYVRIETLNAQEKKCAASHLLVMLGLIAFFIQVIQDVAQSFEMAGWVVLNKTSKQMETLEYLVDKKGEVSFKNGMTKVSPPHRTCLRPALHRTCTGLVPVFYFFADLFLTLTHAFSYFLYAYLFSLSFQGYKYFWCMPIIVAKLILSGFGECRT